MTKKDLKVHDIVELRNGNVAIVLPNDLSEDGMALFNVQSCGCYEYLHKYTDDLSNPTNGLKDIMKVSKSSISPWTHLSMIFNESKPDYWHWKRKEPKELTVAEIEKLLGYPVKIVKE